MLEMRNKMRASFQMIIHDIRRVEKERLSYDLNDMIGAIGGSLGKETNVSSLYPITEPKS